MTKETLILSLATEAIMIGTTVAAFNSMARFKHRTLDEVGDYLRRLAEKEVQGLFDRAEEEKLMAFWSPANFRRDQRARLDLAREYVSRMYHNVKILYEWANTELLDMKNHNLSYESELIDKIQMLRREARTFCTLALLALAHMWIWSVFHFDEWKFFPVPSVAGLRRVGSSDILRAYARVKTAAVALAHYYGDDYSSQIDANM